MSPNELRLDTVRDALFSAFPELLERIWATFGSYYRLEDGTPDETPGVYPIFEDIVKELLFELLETCEDEAMLIRLFQFFEEMASSAGLSISRDLLGIAILEPLVCRKEALRSSWGYMGPKMKELAVQEADQQGRPESLPD